MGLVDHAPALGTRGSALALEGETVASRGGILEFWNVGNTSLLSIFIQPSGCGAPRSQAPSVPVHSLLFTFYYP